jgi:hypothetical protein
MHVCPMVSGKLIRYARMNFGLDRLANYCTDEITDPILELIRFVKPSGPRSVQYRVGIPKGQ